MHEPKLHAILPRPHDYNICDFRYLFDTEEPSQSFIDLTLRNHAETVTLRFWQPTKLKIEEGFPNSTGGMVFYDRTGDQLENITIEVADFESSHGSITFFARRVEIIARKP